jgi:hypothetical protein
MKRWAELMELLVAFTPELLCVTILFAILGYEIADTLVSFGRIFHDVPPLILRIL